MTTPSGFPTGTFAGNMDGNITDGDWPNWISNILGQYAHNQGNHASLKLQNAIASLEDVNGELPENADTCPICYETYDARIEPESSNLNTFKAVYEPLEELLLQNGLASPTSALSFNDPPLYMPVDEGAQNTLRFPQRNLCTLEKVTSEEMFPSLGAGANLNRSEPSGHLPVRIRDCGHTFGRECIVEWLKKNATCPICRQGMATRNSNMNAVRASQVERNCDFRYAGDHDAMLSLLALLTDMLAPTRRVNGVIGTHVPQDWGTPYYPEYLATERTVTREPPLVMPRQATGTSSWPIN